MTALGDLVLVRWRDSFSQIDDMETPEDYIVETSGWLVESGSKFTKVASERTPEGWRGVTWITTATIDTVAPMGTP